MFVFNQIKLIGGLGLLITSTSWSSNSFVHNLPPKHGLQFYNNRQLFPEGVSLTESKNQTYSIKIPNDTRDLKITVGEPRKRSSLLSTSINVTKKVDNQFQDRTITTAEDGIISVTDCQGQISEKKVQNLRCVVISRTLCSQIQIQKKKLRSIKGEVNTSDPAELAKQQLARQNKIDECRQVASEYAQVLESVNQAYGNGTIGKQVQTFYEEDTAKLNARIESLGLSPDSKFLGLLSIKPKTSSDPDSNLKYIKKFSDTFDDMRAINRIFDLCESQPQFTQQNQHPPSATPSNKGSSTR